MLSSMVVTDYDKQFSFTIDELGQKCIDQRFVSSTGNMKILLLKIGVSLENNF